MDQELVRHYEILVCDSGYYIIRTIRKLMTD
jgi:hypothetical protein